MILTVVIFPDAESQSAHRVWFHSLYKLSEEVGVSLAVSLHAANDELRDELVPINRKHPIGELLDACWHYADRQNLRSVTFEYTMLKDVNDSAKDANSFQNF